MTETQTGLPTEEAPFTLCHSLTLNNIRVAVVQSGATLVKNGTKGLSCDLTRRETEEWEESVVRRGYMPEEKKG